MLVVKGSGTGYALKVTFFSGTENVGVENDILQKFIKFFQDRDTGS